MVKPGATAAAFTAALLLLAGVSTSPAAVDPALVAARNYNPSLKSYTFSVSVAMRMQTFPWMHFRMAGTGDYIRGRQYVIHFTQTPFFARSIKAIDLSAVDPTMWPERFWVSVEGNKDGMTTYLLRSRKIDPSDPNPLVVADVSLDSNDAPRAVDLHYSSGEIQMNLKPEEMQGYHLPSSFDVNVRMPGQNLLAHADFSDYTITEEAASASSSGPTRSRGHGIAQQRQDRHPLSRRTPRGRS